jgi:hypothetical protein
MDDPMSEKDMQNSIRIELSKRGIATFRMNCGLFYTKDGRPIDTGLPPGTSDLLAVKEGQAIWIEVKRPDGKITPLQAAFIKQMKERYGCKAGIARSVSDALAICGIQP